MLAQVPNTTILVVTLGPLSQSPVRNPEEITGNLSEKALEERKDPLLHDSVPSPD